ncbi:hypothetical protein [Sorangium sp. So ce1335]|uniref:hypothetical protein n=1 Tax=Sorangium sp. So ce1335 TaxID=3133335 RepID=UPI003F62E3F8
MRDRRWLSLGLVAVTSAGLFGCIDVAGGGPKSGQIGGVEGGEIASGCHEEGEAIAADAVSPLGFSAEDVVSALSGERSAPLTWAKGGSTTATLSLGEIISARFVQSTTPPSSGSGGAELALAVDCADHLQIEVPLAFATEDGAFDETFTVTLRALQASSASFTYRIDLDALQGTYEVTEVNPAEFRKVFVYLNGTLSSTGVDGVISGVAESHPTSDGPDGMVSAQMFNVAEF